MGFLDRVKENLQESATMAREGMEKVSVKRELAQEYGELGRLAFDLVEKGELTHPALDEQADKIRSLQEELAGIGAAQEEPEDAEPAASAAPAETSAPEPSAPAASPSVPPRIPPRADV